ncbi:MarR family winged helix-turn-helix transcriptional regulator [Kineococcus gynurae]|uniref:MarR family winged helix-turn-helix transcriptional regulator n=1 Tax=Kineococcus gynurae TaxID=452979 RepID=A0ABV5LW18_9ACTN
MASPAVCAELVDVLPQLIRARRTMTGDTPSTLALLGLTAVQGPLSVSDIAGRLGLDLSTVSRQVAQLRSQGLVLVDPDPQDRRSHRCSPTPTGLDVLREHRRHLVDRLADRLHDWDDADVSALTTLLARFASPDPREPRKA